MSKKLVLVAVSALVLLLFAITFACYKEKQLIFPTLAISILAIFVFIIDTILAKKDGHDTKSERVKFLFQYIILPVFAGFLLYLVTDRVYGTKEKIIIGISNFSYSDTIDFASVYKKMYIEKANEMLGGYKSSFEFDIVTISGGYDKLWDALDKGRIDLALVSPYNFRSKYKDGESKFSEKAKDAFVYKIIGQKFTEIGTEYSPGFLMNKKFRFSNESDRVVTDATTLRNFIKNKKIKHIYLTHNTLSTSGRVIPENWLFKDSFHVFNSETPCNTKRVITTGTMAENFTDVCTDIQSPHTMCSFSNDMWNNLKKLNPEMAKKLFFVNIERPIPMDVLVTSKGYYDRLNSNWACIVDLIKLRNTDINKNRGDIILGSLRYFIERKTQDTIINDYKKSSIWDMRNDILEKSK